MEPITPEQRNSLIASFQKEAIHLEMRDVYSTRIEKDRFQRWMSGEALDPAEEEEWWRPWRAMMRRHLESGRVMRRLRIVSEPVTAYMRFEWGDAEQLVKAGEDVRWLPRHRASTLLFPGNDFWLFDNQTVAFTHFSGNGEVIGHELTIDPGILKQCREAFETAWKLAIPHGEYVPS